MSNKMGVALKRRFVRRTGHPLLESMDPLPVNQTSARSWQTQERELQQSQLGCRARLPKRMAVEANVVSNLYGHINPRVNGVQPQGSPFSAAPLAKLNLSCHWHDMSSSCIHCLPNVRHSHENANASEQSVRGILYDKDAECHVDSHC